ncbi:hypothetical protein ACWEQN_35560 [Streptomyces sp. NPDC004129]
MFNHLGNEEQAWPFSLILINALGVNPQTAMRYAELAGTDYLGYATLRSLQGPEGA